MAYLPHDTSIKNVQASAAALITAHPEGGETTSARVLVDDAPVAVAQAPTYHQAESFELSRDGETTSRTRHERQR